MNILQRIVKDKLDDVNQRLGKIAGVQMRKRASDNRVPLDFKDALSHGGLSIISEVKKASPSKGVIRPDFDPVAIVRSYEQNGANCISVLTEENYFQGHPDYLVAVKRSCALPILRKDFIVDVRQIRESYELGADAILLIVSILTSAQLSDYLSIAEEFGMSCLIEVHSPEELETALACSCGIIGINNRNLETFDTNINHSIALRKQIPQGVVCVSESGIRIPDDCLRLANAGFDAILVGETLMRQPDPGLALLKLMKGVR